MIFLPLYDNSVISPILLENTIRKSGPLSVKFSAVLSGFNSPVTSLIGTFASLTGITHCSMAAKCPLGASGEAVFVNASNLRKYSLPSACVVFIGRDTSAKERGEISGNSISPFSILFPSDSMFHLST
ncbi:hypothetical protein SDC9_115437 [bioreactor metagenome]|uniref:Uncharacterized protein n=1 Tax=bioreactor metagenome TaxID=1076179 RepID=A0A645C3G8_9ZZZZ